MSAHNSGDHRHGVEWVQLWDGRRWPGRIRGGLPEFRFGQAPPGLSTRRQQRERGLSRGGQEPFARLTWKRDQRFAWLYVDERARTKRTPSDKQLAAVNKALAARKVCAECGPVDHFVRTTDRLCGECHAAGVTPTDGGTAGWRAVQAWQDENAGDGAEHNAHTDASAAAKRAATALTRATDRIDSRHTRTHQTGRDEELTRWHRRRNRTDSRRADRNRQPARHLVEREGSGMTTPTTTPGTSPNTAAAELRAYYGCRDLEARGLRAVPASDEHGQPTGQVAIDADAFCDWLDDLYQEDGD